MEKLWLDVHPATTNRKMSDYIEVTVKDFPHIDYEAEKFTMKSEDLGSCLSSIAQRGTPEQAQCVSGFAKHLEMIWKDICDNKKIITAANYKLAMSVYICNEIKTEMLNALDKIEGYECLKSGASTSLKDFNTELKSFLEGIKSRYEEATKEYDMNIRNETMEQMEMRIVEIFQSTFRAKVESLIKETLSKAVEMIGTLEESAFEEWTFEYIEKFDNDSCSDLHPFFEGKLEKYRNKLLKELRLRAKEEAAERKKKEFHRNRATKITGIVFHAFAATAAIITGVLIGDPISTTTGISSFGRVARDSVDVAINSEPPLDENWEDALDENSDPPSTE